MEKELIDFVKESKLSPFEKTTGIKMDKGMFKTKEAREIYSRVIEKIEKNFNFQSTLEIINYIGISQDKGEIERRQNYFKHIDKEDYSFLRNLTKPKSNWKPKYEVVVVTEDEKTFNELKNLDCPVKILLTDSDISELQFYDIVQAIECENYSIVLERLPQVVFIDSIEEVYLERYVEIFAGWIDNLNVILNKCTNVEILKIAESLIPLFELAQNIDKEKIKRADVESALEKINSDIENELKDINITGANFFNMLKKGDFPEEIKKVISKSVRNSGLSEEFFNFSVPVSIDEDALEKRLREQDIGGFVAYSQKINRNSQILKNLNSIISELEARLIIADFKFGILKWNEVNNFFPIISDEFLIDNSRNIFLPNPQPISFHLDSNNKCSILTGANSGGKTTLLEHIIQILSISYLGLSLNSNIKIPIFKEVYYFAKNKGSATRGAFENLLTQIAQIEKADNSLILADEIEAVTEPGVAGKIISASAEFFINKGCFLVIATHLGHEIIKRLPKNARIDGIEAKGLNEFNELIVDHNPFLGRLAHSTPELIVEKMARTIDKEYFRYLNDYLKNY